MKIAKITPEVTKTEVTVISPATITLEMSLDEAKFIGRLYGQVRGQMSKRMGHEFCLYDSYDLLVDTFPDLIGNGDGEKLNITWID